MVFPVAQVDLRTPLRWEICSRVSSSEPETSLRIRGSPTKIGGYGNSRLCFLIPEMDDFKRPAHLSIRSIFRETLEKIQVLPQSRQSLGKSVKFHR